MFPIPRPKDAYTASHSQSVAFFGLYTRLLFARWEMVSSDRDPREEPVPLAAFLNWRKEGEEALLWMLYHGHIQHFRSLSADADGRVPLPEPAQSLIFTDASCFVLTDAGAAFAYEFQDDVCRPINTGLCETAVKRLLMGILVPAFHAAEHMLTWGRHVVKTFRRPAPNQELVLSAGEELAWPRWWDDPLPPVAGIEAKVRLHDAIKNLKLHQETPILDFKGDGTGTRVGWGLRTRRTPES